MAEKISTMGKYLRDGRAPIPKRELTSRVMRANKAKDTEPEIALRRALYKAGLRGYRLHTKGLPGRPDIVFMGKKVAIFVNGCFWHRCPHCKLPIPKTHRNFWISKFNANKVRDLKKGCKLKRQGWKVIVIWECQINGAIGKTIAKITRAIG